MGRFVGDDTRVVGIHAHNPLGITFATDVYPYFYGADVEPINASEFRKLVLHPALTKHKDHLKIIVGGPGAWQIEKKNLQDEWQADCIVDGEAEDVVLPLFVSALPGETREVTQRSLDLLFALKNSKWVVVPTLFVPLEDTRLQNEESAKLFNLTDLQWELFFTCWRYNMDFWRRQRSTQWKFNLGILLYYYLLGRKLFGSNLKYPLFRLAHFPEWYLRRHLYLDFSGRVEPRYRVPEHVSVPEHRYRPPIPELETVQFQGAGSGFSFGSESFG